MKTKITFLFIAVIILSIAFSGVNAAATSPVPSPVPKLLTVQEISKFNNAVVLLKTFDKENIQIGTGSGFFVSANGMIATNFHVIEGAYTVQAVTNDGTKYYVSGVVNFARDRDTAVLKVNSDVPFPYIKLGDSNKIQLGESIVVISSPLGLQNTVSTGIVSSIRANMVRNVKGTYDIQITAPISPGSSGGVMMNMYGEAIGVTFATIIDAQNLNFAVPINEIKYCLNPKPLTTIPELNKMYSDESTDSSESIKKMKFASDVMLGSFYMDMTVRSVESFYYSLDTGYVTFQYVNDYAVNAITYATNDYNKAIEDLEYDKEYYSSLISSSNHYAINVLKIGDAITDLENTLMSLNTAKSNLASYYTSKSAADNDSFWTNMSAGYKSLSDAITKIYDIEIEAKGIINAVK